ncbi:MAG: hypothetical protein CTY18_05895 [Methylomonas sp.]|nr:MAG: hypothetical protein CTY24_12960 [Methylobacter sp.]PPD36006.1 MAG: hypothetical protein CTY18_05895 [Methylomonas sp.]
MTPIFKILADSADITSRIQQRLLSIRTSDEAGFKSDTCTIELDDRDARIELPRHGAKLDVSLGYAQSGLNRVGIYTVDEASGLGFPETLTINAKAADVRDDLKSRKSRSFDNITFRDLVTTLATENALTGRISADLDGVFFPHLDQTDESDLHFLTRLAKRYNAVAKITHGVMLVTQAGQSKSISGALLETVYISKHQISDFNWLLADRGKYAAVNATWFNKATGQKVIVSTSTKKPAYTLRHTYDTEREAIDAAKSKQSELDQGSSTLDITLAIGDSTLFAETPLVLRGFRPEIDNLNWTITRLEHNFSDQGFTTAISAKIKP